MNLIKQNQRKTIVTKITSNGKTHHKQADIKQETEDFYKNLYIIKTKDGNSLNKSTLYSERNCKRAFKK